MEASKAPDFESFQKWYLAKSGHTFDASKISSEESAPYADGKTFMEQISASVGKVRDEFIVQTVTHLLNQYKHVFVVYGGSHLASERKVFEDLLGKPISESSEF